MKLRETIANVRIQNILEREDEFEFPAFIRCARKTLGITRKSLADEMGIHTTKLHYLESGNFKRMPEISILSFLSEYLGIPQNIIVKKARNYVEGVKK